MDGGNDSQILRYDTTVIPGFGLALSAELDDEIDTDVGYGDAALGIGARYSVNQFDGSVDVGLGYRIGMVDLDYGSAHRIRFEGTVNGTIIGASLRYAANTNLSVVLNWSRQEYDNGETLTIVRDGSTVHPGQLSGASDNRIGLGIGYITGPVTLDANWGSRRGVAMLTETFSDGSIGQPQAAAVEHTGFGLSAAYAIGDGAAVQFGYGDSEDEWTLGEASTQTASDSGWSLGLAFSF